MDVMETRAVSLGSVSIGAASWRDGTERAVQRAERLMRRTRAGAVTVLSRPQTRAQTSSASVTVPGSTEDTWQTSAGAEGQSFGPGREEKVKSPMRPRTTGATLWSTEGAVVPGHRLRAVSAQAALFPGLREVSVGGTVLLPGPSLREASVGGTVLHEASVGGPVLCEASVGGTVLHEASVGGPVLCEASVGGAVLPCSSLREPSVRDSVVHGPSLHEPSVGGTVILPGPSLREVCALASTTVAGSYMTAVRGVEAGLRAQAARVAQEAIGLQREKRLLQQTLHKLRSDLKLNQSSSQHRTQRAAEERECDGADELLKTERRELIRLKQELEETLRSTLTQIQSLSVSSRRLLACASERALVLELLPLSGSVRKGRARGRTPNTTQSQALPTSTGPPTPPDPTGPCTPECKAALGSSCSSLSNSQQLRRSIRAALSDALLRQRAIQQTVNDGLLKKVAETVTLQQSLCVTRGATRQALNRKQREIDLILHNHGRAQGPESSGDIQCREKLDRPLVKVYHRHPGTQLPEAAQLIQGSAVLGRCLSSRQAELDRLRCCYALLHSDLQRKSAAAAVDLAVLRMRRRHQDKHAVPVFLQQDTLRSSTAFSCTQ